MGVWRVGVSVLVTGCVYAAVFLSGGCASRPEPLWVFVAPEPVRASRLSVQDVAGIEWAINTALSQAAKPVDHPEQLAVDAAKTIECLLSDDPADYLAFRTEQGLVVNRVMAHGLAEQYKKWTLASADPPDVAASDEEFLTYIWQTAPKRRFRFTHVETDTIAAGRGAVLHIGRHKDWPFNGGFFTSPLFSPPSGPIQHDVGVELEGSPRSAFVRFIAHREDGSKAHVRLHYFFLAEREAWTPCSIIARSPGRESTIPVY